MIAYCCSPIYTHTHSHARIPARHAGHGLVGTRVVVNVDDGLLHNTRQQSLVCKDGRVASTPPFFQNGANKL